MPVKNSTKFPLFVIPGSTLWKPFIIDVHFYRPFASLDEMDIDPSSLDSLGHCLL